jgi:hypothetical protein
MKLVIAFALMCLLSSCETLFVWTFGDVFGVICMAVIVLLFFIAWLIDMFNYLKGGKK